VLRFIFFVAPVVIRLHPRQLMTFVHFLCPSYIQDRVSMYKKPSGPLYSNVSGAKYKSEDLTGRNEPTYYNTVINKLPTQPCQAIYSNVNYQAKPNNIIYSNVSETNHPTYKNSQYPLYDNLKPLGT